MSKLPAPLDAALPLCLFVGLGAFLLRAAAVQLWYPLVTPWRAMALVGALVGAAFTLWARARGGAAVQPAHLGASWLAASVAAALLTMPIVYLANGIFDRSPLTPRSARVVRAATRASTRSARRATPRARGDVRARPLRS